MGRGWADLDDLADPSLDRLIIRTLATVEGDEFPAADRLSITLALAHIALWLLVIAALSGTTGLLLWEKLAVFVAAGLFMGQVSNSNAHELIHRPGRWLRRAGRWVYISVLFGHHLSEHTLVHHVHGGTHYDPSIARHGESFYRFFARAWRGGFRDGLRAENKRSALSRRPKWRHPYLDYIIGAGLVLMIAALIGGSTGVLAAVGLSGLAQTQLMLSDYVQHYGLSPRIRADGKPEPVGSRHSDHHANPARPFPALRLEDNMPMLPRSLPVMACVALFPRLWRRVMPPPRGHVARAC
jgi:alkane 1-monooxygenase